MVSQTFWAQAPAPLAVSIIIEPLAIGSISFIHPMVPLESLICDQEKLLSQDAVNSAANGFLQADFVRLRERRVFVQFC